MDFEALRRKVRLAEKRSTNYHQFLFVGPSGRPPLEYQGVEGFARRRYQGACVRQVSSRSLRLTPIGWLSAVLAGLILAPGLCISTVFLSVPRVANSSDPSFPDPSGEGEESPEDIVIALGARSLCPTRRRSCPQVPHRGGDLRKHSWTWTLAAANRVRLAWRSPVTGGGLGGAGGRTPRRWIESQRC